jgi:transposase
MCSVTVYVGLDYSQSFVQVCVLSASGEVLGTRACANDGEVLTAYVARFGTKVRAAIECGTGAANLAEDLTRRGWSVDMAHAGFVRRMKNNPDKTDLQDAQVLADLVRVGYLPRVWLAPEAIRELRRLVRYRQELAERRRQIKQRMRGLLREARQQPPSSLAGKPLRPWTKAWWAWAEQQARLGSESRWVFQRHQRELEHVAKQLVEVEQRLEQVTANDPLVAHLLTQRGIGPVTAWTLRAEIGQFDRFRTGKQLARFCGLSPQNASSGPRQADAGLIRAASPVLRATLIEAAHRLARLEPRWVQFKARLVQAGKPGAVAAAAVANRWVRWLFHQIQHPTVEVAA